MKLVSRLLTEMLEVRILPGEPKLFVVNKLQSLSRAFGSRPNAWVCEVEICGAEVVEMKALLDNVAKVDRRCHKNVVARLDFRAAASLLVAAESTPASRLDRAFGS